MSKIFSVDYRKGSFIESVNKIVGTPTSVSKLIRTDKGTALARAVNHGGVTYTTGSKSLSKFTVVAWIKQRTTDTGDSYCIALIGATQIIRRNNSATSYDNYFDSAGLGLLSVPTSTSLNKWMQFVVTYDGASVISSINNKQLVSSPSATTATLDYTSIIIGRGIYASRYSDSDILKFEVYDDVISDKEIELDYKALLESQVTEKPIKHFELVKPTDLSYLKDRGLLLAYNFKPNGTTLVDISGNAKNGTIQSGCVVEKNQLFIPLNKVVTFTSIAVPVSQNTICWRGKVKSITGTFAKVFTGAGYGMFNPTFTSFLLRAAVDSIVTLSTGLTTSNLNKDFDFVITRNGDVFKLYINGVLANTRTVTSTTPLAFSQLGENSTSSGEINYEDFRVYNRELSLQEIKDYHNSFIKPILLEDWSGSAVGDLI